MESSVIDPAGLQQFKDNILSLKKISKRVVVFYNLSPDDVRISEHSSQKLNETLKQIQIETGAEILNFSIAVHFNNEDYYDMFHLNRSGQDKMTTLMTEYIRNLP